MDTLLVASIVTGNLKIGGSIAGTELVTKVLLYYLHERAWMIVPWGKRAPSGAAEQSMD